MGLGRGIGSWIFWFCRSVIVDGCGRGWLFVLLLEMRRVEGVGG